MRLSTVVQLYVQLFTDAAMVVLPRAVPCGTAVLYTASGGLWWSLLSPPTSTTQPQMLISTTAVPTRYGVRGSDSVTPQTTFDKGGHGDDARREHDWHTAVWQMGGS